MTTNFIITHSYLLHPEISDYIFFYFSNFYATFLAFNEERY